MRRTLAALAAAAMLSAPMVATPAEVAAQHKQEADGLVVVQIGEIKDVVDLQDTVDLNAAVAAIVQACDLADVNAAANVIAALTLVDQNNKSVTFCKAETGPVTAKNNNKNQINN